MTRCIAITVVAARCYGDAVGAQVGSDVVDDSPRVVRHCDGGGGIREAGKKDGCHPASGPKLDDSLACVTGFGFQCLGFQGIGFGDDSLACVTGFGFQGLVFRDDCSGLLLFCLGHLEGDIGG